MAPFWCCFLALGRLLPLSYFSLRLTHSSKFAVCVCESQFIVRNLVPPAAEATVVREMDSQITFPILYGGEKT